MPFALKKVKTPGSKRICGGRFSILSLALATGAGAGFVAGDGETWNLGFRLTDGCALGCDGRLKRIFALG